VNARLAPDLVWPVRARDLRSALVDVVDLVDLSWVHWKKQASTTPIAADWPPLTGLTVWIYPVAKRDHQAVRAIVDEQVLPDLARWCRNALRAPEGWQLMRHERRWSITGETITANERQGVETLRGDVP
jgi:hypothetical protein